MSGRSQGREATLATVRLDAVVRGRFYEHEGMDSFRGTLDHVVAVVGVAK